MAEGTNQSKEWGADEQELRRGQITGCDNIHLKQEGLERMMRELSGQLFAWQDEENMICRIIKILSEVLLTGETHLKKEEVEKNLMAVRNRKSRLLDLLLDNTISKQGYKSKQKELEQEEQRWTERLERMDVEEEKIRQTKERLVGIEQKLRADGCEKIQAGLLMQVMDHIRVFEDRLEIKLNPVALPGVASVHGWIMQKPGVLQKDYLQEYLIEVPTARYFSDTRIIKKKKKESIPDILRKEPFLTNKELAKRLDVTFSTLRRWLADYKKKGQIYFDKTGGKGQWRVRE